MGEVKVFSKVLTYSTRKKFEVVCITRDIDRVVAESGILNGFVLVYVPHATAAVIVNEFEPRIAEDYITWLKRFFPPGSGWRHDEIDDNAHAHLASAVIGTSRVFPLIDGRLVRGTWQEILLVELDGPRSARRVVVEVLGI